ncbi:PspA/IM30 family protein [Phenylobacterium sp. LjRoot219]|uniref:PspA/IM30 family protein n=1 Tax=Phenylobacterium sp. LjRoot219 TaxID=3342283 RepID=UPI003ECF616C
MSIWNKFSALFRGAAHEGAQNVVDANALRILDQEIRDADTAQGRARDELAKLAARRRMLETETAQLTDQARKYEASARAALAKGDNDLAREVAQRIADLERDSGQKGGQVTELRASEDKLRQVIAQTDTKIEALRREIEVVKVNESVQRAQSAVIARSGATGSSLGSAADSLKRIKERQTVREEQFRVHSEAEDRRTGADLDAKLQAAGILPGHVGADDILARLQAPAQPPPMQIEAPRLQIEEKAPSREDGSDR